MSGGGGRRHPCVAGLDTRPEATHRRCGVSKPHRATVIQFGGAAGEQAPRAPLAACKLRAACVPVFMYQLNDEFGARCGELSTKTQGSRRSGARERAGGHPAVTDPHPLGRQAPITIVDCQCQLAAMLNSLPWALLIGLALCSIAQGAGAAPLEAVPAANRSVTLRVCCFTAAALHPRAAFVSLGTQRAHCSPWRHLPALAFALRPHEIPQKERLQHYSDHSAKTCASCRRGCSCRPQLHPHIARASQCHLWTPHPCRPGAAAAYSTQRAASFQRVSAPCDAAVQSGSTRGWRRLCTPRAAS